MIALAMLSDRRSPPARKSFTASSDGLVLDDSMTTARSTLRRHSVAWDPRACGDRVGCDYASSPLSNIMTKAMDGPRSRTGLQHTEPCKRYSLGRSMKAPSMLHRVLPFRRRQRSIGSGTKHESNAPQAPCDLAILPTSALGDQPAQLQAIVDVIRQGFRANVPPVAVDDGTGGVYFLRSRAQRIVGVFKPTDEEPFAINNPKRRNELPVNSNPRQQQHSAEAVDTWDDPTDQSGIRGGIGPGHSAIREVAACLLDHEHRAGVPPTALVSAVHKGFYYQRGSAVLAPKIGSLQAYVPHDCSADDVSPSVFSVEQVQALAILDIRLANQDRHGGNVLVVRGGGAPREYTLVPIDHGACLPRLGHLDETSFLWLDWPQARVPFTAASLEYIAALDPEWDIHRLITHLPPGHPLEPEAVSTLAICTTLLQVCALEFGMSAAEIGALMCREDPSEPSVLERLVQSTLREVLPSRPSVALSMLSPEWTSYRARLMRQFRDRLVATQTTSQSE